MRAAAAGLTGFRVERAIRVSPQANDPALLAYAAGREPHPETDPLNLADPVRAVTVKGAADMEQQVLSASGLDAIVLRYGLLYGPGTWREASSGPKPALHVDAAAHAALLA